MNRTGKIARKYEANKLANKIKFKPKENYDKMSKITKKGIKDK